MSRDRDIQAFDDRARSYEEGWLGRLHHDIADRVVDIALARAPGAETVLDVGCGTGYLLRQMAARLPEATRLEGVDPAPTMVEVARASAGQDERIHFQTGTAEQLPFSNREFQLVISTTSFDHWADQRAGLAECLRVMTRGGRFVLADQFSAWLAPTLLIGHRGRARTTSATNILLREVGFRGLKWHGLGILLVKAVSATA
ncbi:MAG TPA: class I SAM-dependent methyltransferase [Acidimicrobiales bacterium]|nr:class I SAM-dependent methyltransferase [Acidimicrobiales bacterium]